MGASSEPVVWCKDCEMVLDEPASLPPEQRQPCPNCGSLTRHVSMTLASTVTVHGQLALKGRTPGEKRPFIEQKVGDSYSVVRGRWMRLRRLIDRRNNRYVETVEDPETGEVLREVDEPLTQHVGRGDAARQEGATTTHADTP